MENTAGKGEIAHYEQFVLFVFSTRLANFQPFSSSLKLSSAKSFSLEESKICHLGKALQAVKCLYLFKIYLVLTENVYSTLSSISTHFNTLKK